jgi:amino acid transporter
LCAASQVRIGNFKCSRGDPKFLFCRYEIDDDNGEPLEDDRTGLFKKLFNVHRITNPTYFTSSLATVLVTLYSIFCIMFGLVVSKLGTGLQFGEPLPITLLVIVVILIVITMAMLARQPVSKKELHFRAPFTPWLPALSILINIYLMLELDYMVSF